ncbi:hypothetical protein NXY56_006575 [Leishmania guyanensis]|uniref:Uncharacterized protein n=1 Tax=Leishmania guyanensis TaxID=5670 RepID=A0A1E1IU97_LEIGU|nr:hypothetical protein, conserved [Leishmania guyanensis]
MLRARRPAGPGRAPLSDLSSSSDNSRREPMLEGRPKRCRTPCQDEVAFKELQARKLDVQTRVRQQIEVLSGLESNVLDFYYTHMLRFEPLLEFVFHTPLSAATAPASVSNGVLGEGLTEVFPELKSTTALAGICDGCPPSLTREPVPIQPAAVPAKTRYYYNSALMRLYREVALQEKDLAQKYASETTRLAAAELSVQRDIIDGSLAGQLRIEQEEQEALNKLLEFLAGVTAQCAAYRQLVQAAGERIKGIEKAREACLARKTNLEAKKLEQMGNAERIKEEVAAYRRCVEVAATELEKRKLINRSLEDEIEKRRASMKRRRKE